MKGRLLIFSMIIFLIGGAVFAADLTVDYKVDVSGKTRVSYFTFKGPIRYMAAEQDHYDGVTSASLKKSTEMFQPYRYDVKGKNALADGLRGLFLFGVAGSKQAQTDKLTVDKAGNGVITIQYTHRGTAYKIVTDNKGNIVLPDGTFMKRSIGFIPKDKDQIISKDFSSDQTAAKVDWGKVWNSRIKGGKAVASGSDKKTGDIIDDGASPDSMYYWKGALKAEYTGNILTISGGLDAVKR